MFVDRYAGDDPLVNELLAGSNAKSFNINDFMIGPMNKQDIPRHGGDPQKLEEYLRRKYQPSVGTGVSLPPV